MIDQTDPHTPLPPPRGRALPVALALLLVFSLAGNAALLVRGPRTVVREVRVEPAPLPPLPPPPAVECPPAVVCEVCEVCPEPAPGGGGGGGGARPPRVDEAAAAEGEAHVAQAEAAGERDPVQLAAQRRMVDGVDRIVTSHSAASAERFIQRNLPSLASMDCAFRDPAVAEHARMRLREMNALARPPIQLSEAQLVRFERDLRCPRE